MIRLQACPPRGVRERAWEEFMVRKTVLLIMLGFFLAIGGLWGLRAQDPAAPQKPVTMPPEPQKPATMPAEPQKPAATTTKPAATTTQMDLSGTYAGTFNCEA